MSNIEHDRMFDIEETRLQHHRAVVHVLVRQHHRLRPDVKIGRRWRVIVLLVVPVVGIVQRGEDLVDPRPRQPDHRPQRRSAGRP
jgi:hypothetical protein